MNKSRPEKINLNTLKVHAEWISEMLSQELHKNARLKRVDKAGKTNFSFYPTKSEYFLIRIKMSLAEKAAMEREKENV